MGPMGREREREQQRQRRQCEGADITGAFPFHLCRPFRFASRVFTLPRERERERTGREDLSGSSSRKPPIQERDRDKSGRHRRVEPVAPAGCYQCRVFFLPLFVHTH